uniref:Uncharacterized protein n=1 Tax=viral metagenome TaxID=1070528 RepID=A0A6C0KDQ5_9ZZZZ
MKKQMKARVPPVNYDFGFIVQLGKTLDFAPCTA